MSSPDRGPSFTRLARRLLEFLLGPEDRDDILRSLDELLRIRTEQVGRPMALLWYWRQVLGFLIRWPWLGRLERSAQRDRTAARIRTSLLTTTRVDLTVALRRLRRDKGFAASAILVLAVGIGANVAVYSTTFNLLVQPLPFVDSERLVIGHVTRDGSRSGGGFISGPDFRDYRDRNTTFESLGALLPFPQHHTLTGADEPDRVEGTAVSVNLFSTLGVGPQLGRGFAEEEGREGGPSVALISDGLWQRRFGGDTSTVGRTLLIDGEPFTVIGVMPAGFRFLAEAEFWRPMRPDRDASDLRERHNWYAVGRLAAGVTLERAQAEVDAISGQLVEEYPETNAGKGMVLTNLQEDLVKDYRSRLFLLSAAVGVVLLIACGNLTGMLLARAPERRTELSVRAALGASKARLVRQMLCESVVLGTGGGVVGVATAIWMQRVILDYLKVDLPGVHAAQISWPLTGLALAFSLGAGLVAGVYPALAGARGELAEDLKEGCRTNLGGGTRFRGGLVVAQVALSVMVLIGSGLLLKSFTAVRTTDPGFDSGNLLTAEIGLPPAEYSDRGLRTQFFLRLMEEVRRSPGVVSVGLINSLPVRGMPYGFEAFSTDEPDEGKEVCLRSVLPGYFEAMGIPRISGRGLDNEIEPATPPVAVVNRAAARAFFDVENPIGRRLQVDIFGNRQEAEIVGIVEDVRMEGLESAPDPALYLPYQQFPSLTMQVAIRTAGEPALAAAGLRGAVWALDSDVPVADLATMEEVLTGSISERRTIAFSFTLFAALPLILAAFGLYAVLACYVNQRLQELGVRMALGADGGIIGRMVFRRGITLIVAGLFLGLLGSVASTRLIRHLLFNVGPTDLPTLSGVSLFVGAVALVGCLVPTWRAVRMDPIVAFRAK